MSSLLAPYFGNDIVSCRTLKPEKGFHVIEWVYPVWCEPGVNTMTTKNKVLSNFLSQNLFQKKNLGWKFDLHSLYGEKKRRIEYNQLEHTGEFGRSVGVEEHLGTYPTVIDTKWLPRVLN